MMFLFCKIHPTVQLYSLGYSTNRVQRYQKPRKKNQKHLRNSINFVYCPKCDKVYRVKISVSAIKNQINNFMEVLGKKRRDKIKQVKIDVIKARKHQEGKYKRRTGRPYSPKPLPIKITSVRDGWYWSKVANKFHFIKKNRFFCHPNFPINLDLLPVKNPKSKKLRGKMCRTCGRKKGVYSYEEAEHWDKHYEKKLVDDRERYEKKKKQKKKTKKIKVGVTPI